VRLDISWRNLVSGIRLLVPAVLLSSRVGFGIPTSPPLPSPSIAKRIEEIQKKTAIFGADICGQPPVETAQWPNWGNWRNWNNWNNWNNWRNWANWGNWRNF
jgi:hypothetical protein